MEGDEELERIRRKKLKELMKQYSEEAKGASRKDGEEILNKPIKITDGTFTKTIQSNSLVVVDCWAPWCTPCHTVTPIVEEMARDYVGKILFGKLNIDENQRVAMQYQIMSIPTFLVFKRGLLMDRIVGVMPRRMLEQRITH